MAYTLDPKILIQDLLSLINQIQTKRISDIAATTIQGEPTPKQIFAREIVKLIANMNKNTEKPSYYMLQQIFDLRGVIEDFDCNNNQNGEANEIFSEMPNCHLLLKYELAIRLILEYQEDKPQPDENKKMITYMLLLLSSKTCHLYSIMVRSNLRDISEIYKQIYMKSENLYKKLRSDKNPTITPPIHEEVKKIVNEDISPLYEQVYVMLSDSGYSANRGTPSKNNYKWALKQDNLINWMECIPTINSYLSKTQSHTAVQKMSVDLNYIRANSLDYKAFLNILHTLKSNTPLRFSEEEIQQIIKIGIDEKVLDKNTIDILELCRSITK
jgi:hypothetical protein